MLQILCFMWKFRQMNKLFKKHSNQVEFPKKERTNHHYLSHSLRQLYSLVFSLCLKYIWIFYLRSNRCYLHILAKVHNGCGTAIVDMEISISAIKSKCLSGVDLNWWGFHNWCGPWLVYVNSIYYFLNRRSKHILSIIQILNYRIDEGNARGGDLFAPF